MNDHQSQRQLLAYLDEELPEDEKQTVEQHLRTCANCTAEFEKLQRALPEILNTLRECLIKETSPVPVPWQPFGDLLRGKAGESSEGSHAERPPAPSSALSNGSSKD